MSSIFSPATEKRITMITEASTVPASHKATMQHLLSSLIAMVFALAIYPTQAHAQIIGELQANIPFQFHVGNTKFPAGEYRIHVLDDSDLTTMEISSMDDSASALFQVREADTNSEPTKTELLFNKYGNRYFLAELFDQENSSGSKVAESRYEKRIDKATLEAQEHVPAYHQKG